MEKIKIEETSEEFKENGRRFAKCLRCGWLIVISNNGDIKQKICDQIKGLKINGCDPLIIANKFSICCAEPNYKTISFIDKEWIFREIRAEFLSQFR